MLLPVVTCKAEFVPYFLNVLREWTAGVWSSRTLSTCTPVRTQSSMPGDNDSFRSCDVTADQQTASLSSTCTYTPDSNPQPDSRHSSTQRTGCVKGRTRWLSDASPSLSTIRNHQLNSTKTDVGHHRSHRQRNNVSHTDHCSRSSKEHQGRALFTEVSASSVRKSAVKQKPSVEKTTVPIFNLDSNVDFPDMKTSRRYCLYFTVHGNVVVFGSENIVLLYV